MKQFKVIVTPEAKEDLRKYLSYLRKRKKSPQAVQNVLMDFRETKKVLSVVAASLGNPASKPLTDRKLKRINFIKHNYFMLYYIGDNDTVYVTDIFHGLENFENKLK